MAKEFGDRGADRVYTMLPLTRSLHIKRGLHGINSKQRKVLLFTVRSPTYANVRHFTVEPSRSRSTFNDTPNEQRIQLQTQSSQDILKEQDFDQLLNGLNMLISQGVRITREQY